MFQKTTQKSESRTSSGLSPLPSHLIRPLPSFPPFPIPPPSPSCSLFATRLLSILLGPSSAPLPPPTLTFCLSCRPSLPSLHLLAALFQPGYCLPSKCLKSIPPTLHSSVCELPPNLSFRWQLHNVLRSRAESGDADAHSNLIVHRWQHCGAVFLLRGDEMNAVVTG